MASKKLRPGSFKSGSGKSRGATRRTGRTTGISQSAFGGYGFQGQHPATRKPSESPQELSQDEEEPQTDETADQAEEDQQEDPQRGDKG